MDTADRKPIFKPGMVLRADQLATLAQMIMKSIVGRDKGLAVRAFGDQLIITDPTAKPIAALPYLFEVTAEAVDGIIEAKRVKIDGDAVGDMQVFTEYTG